MTGHPFSLAGAQLIALPSGALHWPAERLLCVSDLHLGKAERAARRALSPLPPYETQDTLARLEEALQQTQAETVVCLGDSFDDDAAARALPQAHRLWIATLQAGRRWIWIEGNHDPGPVDLGGEHLAELSLSPLTFRHIALPGAQAEVSGHYHPKAGLRGGRARPCFLLDGQRLILPAFGTYTGGLRTRDPALSGLMGAGAVAILTGSTARPIPMPR
ncbi:ligase-associated DNA damage response endonuclease PdeM [Pseudooceanicola marinus]|uniref:ligase-associated DNA damage response endonuclease PdeM n=1 Tax=Pseudooceanicola marinus TaxID=396013 RepID=UPI001CD2AFC5|nr:ligase-associated DNA damage response endonuclease PdeM [Pseudooceanicola marinus]MCA1336668.1 ligase-associated DNA damage response endonuclease PdeM [Pseudooceanicola marinus]